MQLFRPALLLCLLVAALAPAQGPAAGTRLYQVIGSGTTTLVDNGGNVVHTWVGVAGNQAVHLCPDGTLLRALQTAIGPGGGGAGGVQRVAFDGTALWTYLHSGTDYLSHHGIVPLPNGNVLLIVWERKTAAEAIAQGRDPALLNSPDFWPDAIVEVQPTGAASGTVVWEWHVLDHVVQDFDPLLPNYGVVADHPELMDLNFPAMAPTNGDWNHVNAVDYDPIHDWIVISSNSQSEIWIIDHGTTTAEAAGHTGGRWGQGGDFLYRWGNPQAYGRGTAADQQLFQQHDPRFIPPGYPGVGNMTIFNNRWTATQSQVVEIVLPVDPSGNFVLATGARFGPPAPLWSYTSPTFYSRIVSSARRLPNGNTMICSGTQQTIFEVTPAGQTVWLHAPAGLTTPIFHAHYVDRTLWASDATLSAAAGGTIGLDLIHGWQDTGNFYFLLGSASGTAPGFSLGGVTLPLNPDYVMFAMAGSPNTGVFQDTLGTLDLLGRGHAGIAVGPFVVPPALAGVELSFAHLVFDPFLIPRHASNAVSVTIVP